LFTNGVYIFEMRNGESIIRQKLIISK